MDSTRTDPTVPGVMVAMTLLGVLVWFVFLQRNTSWTLGVRGPLETSDKTRDAAYIAANIGLRSEIALLAVSPDGKSITTVPATVIGTPAMTGRTSEWLAMIETDNGTTFKEGVPVLFKLENVARLTA